MNALSNLLKLPLTIWEANRLQPEHDTLTHLRSVADWLIRSQDAHDNGGSAKSFNLLTNRWEPSYPETTGYIIGTFLDLGEFWQNDLYIKRAERMGEWLQSLQLQNGAFPSFDLSTPVVFDTGQILHGLVDLTERLGTTAYQQAVERAAAWLTDIQDPSGAWTHGAYLNTAHTYSTRVAWALLRAGRLLNETRFQTAAIRNVKWALTQQEPNGWFRQNSLKDQDRPILHTIVYAARGLFEIGRLVNHEGYQLAARRPMDVLLDIWKTERRLFGAYDAHWRGVAASRCLVGEAQLSGLWFRMATVWNDRPYAEAAVEVNRRLKQVHHLAGTHLGVRGGLAGSYPVQGRYCFLKYPNWASKFLADTFLLEAQFSQNLKGK